MVVQRPEEAHFRESPSREAALHYLFLAFGFDAEFAVSPGKPEGQNRLNFERERPVLACAAVHPERCRYLALHPLVKSEAEAAVSPSRATGQRTSPAVHISGDPEVADNSGHTTFSFRLEWE